MGCDVAYLAGDHVEIPQRSQIIFKGEHVHFGLAILFAIDVDYLVNEFFVFADLSQIVGREL